MPHPLAAARSGPSVARGGQTTEFRRLAPLRPVCAELARIVLYHSGVETFWIVSEERQRARSLFGDVVSGTPG